MTDVRCECGRLLGKIEGKYDLRCPRCKRVVIGDTGRIELDMVRGPKIPGNMMPVR